MSRRSDATQRFQLEPASIYYEENSMRPEIPLMPPRRPTRLCSRLRDSEGRDHFEHHHRGSDADPRTQASPTSMLVLRSLRCFDDPFFSNLIMDVWQLTARRSRAKMQVLMVTIEFRVLGMGIAAHYSRRP